MNRADRLLALMQALRRRKFPVTARALATELSVSERTLYRDIAALQASGATIRGEAGVGYVLDPGYDLPPLMFSMDELEALMLGARFVIDRGDPELTRAAEDAIAKIEAVLPRDLRRAFGAVALFAPSVDDKPLRQVEEAHMRRAIREERKVDIDYVDAAGEFTRRRIWPIAIGYLDRRRVVVAWCELRKDFRHFRTDRMEGVAVLAERYPERRAVLHKRWEEGLDRI